MKRLEAIIRRHNSQMFTHQVTDAKLIELAKETCTLHKTSDETGFIVWFELKDLKRFAKALRDENVK